MSSGKRRRLGIAAGLLGAACTVTNPAFDQDGGSGQTGGEATVGLTSDGTATTGRPGDGTVGDGTASGGSEGASVCRSNDECANELYCDGEETCDPSHPEADALGCVPPSEPRCPDGAICDEDQQDCVTNCEVIDDADDDGSVAAECGGDDCDDANELVHPGAEEICDDVDNDCDPGTIGDTDVDGDRAISNACCNESDTGVVCGTDCDDFQPNIILPGNDWAHCEGCSLGCSQLEACQGGMCVDARRVFVTSTQYAGDMGSVDAADDLCQGRADDAGLEGTFRAYIRDDDTSIEERLEHATVQYARLDGLRVANDWTDLNDGTLQAPIALDEQREPHMEMGERAWTGVQTGETMFEGDCGGWTSGFDGFGASGDVPAIMPSWRANNFAMPCSFELRLYCIEQGGGG